MKTEHKRRNPLYTLAMEALGGKRGEGKERLKDKLFTDPEEYFDNVYLDKRSADDYVVVFHEKDGRRRYEIKVDKAWLFGKSHLRPAVSPTELNPFIKKANENYEMSEHWKQAGDRIGRRRWWRSHSKLEERVAVFVGIIGLLLSIYLSSFRITGNAIGGQIGGSPYLEILFFIIGLACAIFYLKRNAR